MTDWKMYHRINMSEMMPWRESMEMGHVAIAEVDIDKGSPRPGDMIARNPNNHADKWLVSEKYFQENFVPVLASEVPEQRMWLTFGQAIEALKQGRRVCRAGWNGKDMWLAYMSGMELPPYSTQDTNRKVNDRTAKWIGEDTPLITLPYIAMWTADKKWLPGWLASQTDMLSEDWMILEDR